VACSKKALGGFPYEFEVDLSGAWVGKGKRHARDGADRPHSGIQTETFAEIELRRDLRPVRIAHRRKSHRGKQNGIGLPGGGHRFVRQRDAGVTVQPGAGFVRREVQAESPDAVDQCLKERLTRRHHFRSDTIAWKYCNLKLTHKPSLISHARGLA
jgi:hypothetical protein